MWLLLLQLLLTQSVLEEDILGLKQNYPLFKNFTKKDNLKVIFW